MFKKRSSGKTDCTLPAEQRPWRVQFDEMHICLASLTVHLLRTHILDIYVLWYIILNSIILLPSQFTSWEDKNANINIRNRYFAKFAHFFLRQDSFLWSQSGGHEGKMEPLSLRCGAGKFTLKFAKSWAEKRKSWTEKVFRKFQLSLLCRIAHCKLLFFWHNVVNALWVWTFIADSAQTEHCSTFPCVSVREGVK